MSSFECIKNERKSKVWHYYLLNKKERKAKCISCSQILIISKDGSTSNLLLHLKSNHSTDFKWIKEENKNDKTKSSDKPKKFQPKIIEVMSQAYDIFTTSVQNSKTASNVSKNDLEKMNGKMNNYKTRPEECHMSKECDVCKKMIPMTEFSNHTQNCKSNLSKDPIKSFYEIGDTIEIDSSESSKPVEKSKSNLNQEHHEDALARPISNLVETTDFLTDPFQEYENIDFEEDSKTHANLKQAEENHKTAKENVVAIEGPKTTKEIPADANGQSDENHKTTEVEILPETEELGEEDNICDWVFDAKLVGKIIYADYVPSVESSGGVFKGTVRYYNRKLDKYLLVFEDGSTDLFKEEDVDGDEMWFEEEEKPHKRVKKWPKRQKNDKNTSTDKVVEMTGITIMGLTENDLFNPNSDTNFAPTNETHEMPSVSSIRNVDEMLTISSDSVNEKNKFSKCKICHKMIPFRFINIHLKHKHPFLHDVDRSKRKIEETKQFPYKLQSKGPSDPKQADKSSATQNDVAKLIKVTPKTVRASKKIGEKSEKYVDNNFKMKRPKKTPGLIKCSLCPYSFHPGIILNQHMNLCRKYSSSIESCHKGFNCKLCQFKNPARSEILKHIKKKHPKVADLDKPEENSKTAENVEKEAIEISELQIPVRSEILEHFKMKHPKADLKNPDTGNLMILTGSQIEVIDISDSETSDSEINDLECNTNFQIKSEIIGKQFTGGFDDSALPVYHDSQSSSKYSVKEIQMIETDESEDELEDLSKLTDLSKLYKKLIENISWKKCPLCQCSFSVRPIIDLRHEDLNNHMDNCEEFQKIFKKPQKYCPICQREPKNSIILHIKRHILGGIDSSDSPSESSDDSDSDDIIIISDTDDNDSIDSGVHNDTNDFTNNLNLVPSSTPTKNVQTNKILKNNTNIGEPILETQNCETEDIIPLELFPRVELKEPKPLILSYYECPLPGNTCSKWRSLEDAIAHVETYHRMSMDVFGRMPGIKLAPKILK